MTDWIAAIPAFLIATALVCVPGLFISWGLRVRGFSMLTTAIPASLAVIALSSILAPVIGMPWGIAAPIALAIILALLAILFRRAIPAIARSARPPTAVKWPLIGTGIAAAVITVTLFGAMPRIDAVSQTFDAIFHLNAVRYILDIGSASPFDMDLTAPGSGVFYPTLWHALVSLTVQLTGVSIPMATGAVLFATAAVVWPVGIIALSRALAGSGRRATLAAGILAAALPGMPYLLASYGVLYPTLLAFALLPFVGVAIMQLFGAARARVADPLSPGVRWLLLLGALGAAILAQPSALHVTLMFLGPFMLLVLLRAFRRPRERRGILIALISGVAFLLAAAAAWGLGNTGRSPWSARHGILGALLDGLGGTPHMDGHNWPVAILALVGFAVAILLPRARAFAITSLVFLLVYVIADGFPSTLLRDALLTPWYGDPWRLAALMPVVIIPLAVLGATTLAGAILPPLRHFIGRILRAPRIPKRAVHWAGSLLVLLLFFVSVIGPGMQPMRDYIANKYDDGTKAPLLSQDERLLLERLDESLPKDAVLLTNPWNGGSLAYAISGHRVLIPHTGGRYVPDALVMATGIANGTPDACAAADRLDTGYVLDFGERFVRNDEMARERTEQLQHIDGMQDPPALEALDREGDAVLFRIIGC